MRSNHRPEFSSLRRPTAGLVAIGTALTLCVQTASPAEQATAHEGEGTGRVISDDASGKLETYNIDGRIDTTGPFFQSLGTNGRSCATCHALDQGMTITPTSAGERFSRTNGNDPLFAPSDGANCSDARRSDPKAHSLLLQHGLIRVAETLPVDVKPQFTLSVVHDPYGCALVTDPKTGSITVSVYRRPLPATNLSLLSTVMWDGRETHASLADGSSFLANLDADLTQQALDATLGHAQAAHAPSAKKLAQIVAFERGLYTAQTRDAAAGGLDRHGALGGAAILSGQYYYPGINDVLGADPAHTPFDPSAMTLFGAWAQVSGNDDQDRESSVDARRDIAAGEQLFNTAPMVISNVRGLNDNSALGHPTSFQGTCTTCHDTPNVGNHSLPLPLDIGLGHASLPGMESDPLIGQALEELDLPDLPVYLIQGCPNPFNPGQPASFYTTDPGKALVTGSCGDLDRLKGPILRGLAGRAPYFHNGSAATLMQAVSFYNERFDMKLSQRQKQQLVAFLNSL